MVAAHVGATVTMHSQKNSLADSSRGRFQKTRAPMAKITISCRNQTNDQM